jgi:hypothetical protein
MANETVTELTAKRPGGDFIVDPLDRAIELSRKLQSLLLMTHGEAGEAFRNTAARCQDDFLWCCYSLAEELAEACDESVLIHEVPLQGVLNHG